MERSKLEELTNPSYYDSDGYQLIDFIKDSFTEDELRGFVYGNIIKYLTRQDKKNGIEDILKGRWYLIYYLSKFLSNDGMPGEDIYNLEVIKKFNLYVKNFGNTDLLSFACNNIVFRLIAAGADGNNERDSFDELSESVLLLDYALHYIGAFGEEEDYEDEIVEKDTPENNTTYPSERAEDVAKGGNEQSNPDEDSIINSLQFNLK